MESVTAKKRDSIIGIIAESSAESNRKVPKEKAPVIFWDHVIDEESNSVNISES